MNPETVSFIKEVEKIEDAKELRLLLAALKEENCLLRNRESERLRAESEMSLLYRQMENELKGLRKENDALKKENEALREKVSRMTSDNALKANTIFGRRTEKLYDLMDEAEHGADTEDPLSEDMAEETTEPADGKYTENARKGNIRRIFRNSRGRSHTSTTKTNWTGCSAKGTGGSRAGTLQLKKSIFPQSYTRRKSIPRSCLSGWSM